MHMRVCCIAVFVDEVRLFSESNQIHVPGSDRIQHVGGQFLIGVKVQGYVKCICLCPQIPVVEGQEAIQFVIKIQVIDFLGKEVCLNTLRHTFGYFHLVIIEHASYIFSASDSDDHFSESLLISVVTRCIVRSTFRNSSS